MFKVDESQIFLIFVVGLLLTGVCLAELYLTAANLQYSRNRSSAGSALALPEGPRFDTSFIVLIRPVI